MPKFDTFTSPLRFLNIWNTRLTSARWLANSNSGNVYFAYNIWRAYEKHIHHQIQNSLFFIKWSYKLSNYVDYWDKWLNKFRAHSSISLEHMSFGVCS